MITWKLFLNGLPFLLLAIMMFLFKSYTNRLLKKSSLSEEAIKVKKKEINENLALVAKGLGVLISILLFGKRYYEDVPGWLQYFGVMIEIAIVPIVFILLWFIILEIRKPPARTITTSADLRDTGIDISPSNEQNQA